MASTSNNGRLVFMEIARFMKTICVFCGSNPGNDPVYLETARLLGEELVNQNLALVYGGASVGIMGATADSVLKSSGQVFGVIPKVLEKKEVSHKGLTKLYIVDSMHERKQMMFDLSDGFITLPGGLGSLEEICEVLTWAQLGLHKKPCGFLNIKGYYNSLIAQFDHCVNEGLMQAEVREMILVDTSPLSLLEKFRNYQPPSVEKWIGKKQT
ncbi:MAG: family Rossman fold protein [Bacteriovoracaceae bacterium]|nr:family Rossman fold protein [Bacteriovoracaceae bacterium]